MIQIENLEKYYQKKKVLHDINLQFEKGITGILGPNGAGKTTLFRCIIGTEKYNGKILVSGKGKIGYLPQDFDCFHELTVSEAMDYLALMKDADLSENEELLERVELLSEKNIKVKKLSGGMKRRLGVAQSMIGKPEMIIMDEPTAGLDPESRLQVRNIISGIGADAAILISSHIASDLDAVADRLVFLKQGKICYTGTKEQVLKRMEGKVHEVTMSREEYRQNTIPHTSVRWNGELATVRLVGDNLKFENDTTVTPVLEDAYFYFEGQRSV